MRILSLGAGVQSTTVALLVTHGELPMLDGAIFADTGWEPKAVYAHLDWLEKQLPYPVYRVSAKTNLSIREKWERTTGTRFISLPMFTENGGRLWRQCTKEWKIEPIEAKLRQLLGLAKGQRARRGIQVEQWFGISRDEASRMRDSRHHWIAYRYPLIFDRPMDRTACLRWIQEHGYPAPPRSACIGCPFHSDAEWRRLKTDSPEEFQEAVVFERAVAQATGDRQKQRAYLHRSLVPLDHVDFSTPEDRGQLNWLEECEGLCGV